MRLAGLRAKATKRAKQNIGAIWVTGIVGRNIMSTWHAHAVIEENLTMETHRGGTGAIPPAPRRTQRDLAEVRQLSIIEVTHWIMSRILQATTSMESHMATDDLRVVLYVFETRAIKPSISTSAFGSITERNFVSVKTGQRELSAKQYGACFSFSRVFMLTTQPRGKGILSPASQ